MGFGGARRQEIQQTDRYSVSQPASIQFIPRDMEGGSRRMIWSKSTASSVSIRMYAENSYIYLNRKMNRIFLMLQITSLYIHNAIQPTHPHNLPQFAILLNFSASSSAMFPEDLQRGLGFGRKNKGTINYYYYYHSLLTKWSTHNSHPPRRGVRTGL